MIPTDVRGLTFSRTPQQNINILTLGNPDGVGVFFPNGLIGAISKPTGFNKTASGTDDFPSSPMVAFQVSPRLPPSPPTEVLCCSVYSCCLPSIHVSYMFHTNCPCLMPMAAYPVWLNC